MSTAATAVSSARRRASRSTLLATPASGLICRAQPVSATVRTHRARHDGSRGTRRDATYEARRWTGRGAGRMTGLLSGSAHDGRGWAQGAALAAVGGAAIETGGDAC